MIVRSSILVLLTGCAPAQKPELVLSCPGEWITAMTTDPDGRRLVAGSDRGVIRILDLAAKPIRARKLKTFSSPVTALACLPDGKTAVAGTWEGALVKLDLSDGKIRQTYEEHLETITALEISPDGQYLASGSADDRLIIWDLETGEDLLILDQGNEYDVTTLAFSPDGKAIATGDGENQIKLWDTETGEIVRTLSGHGEPVSQVRYLSKEKLISGSWDRTLRIWDSETSRVLRGHQSEITALQLNEETLFSASEGGTVRVWPLAGEDEPAVLTGAPASVRCLVVTAEGKLVLAGTRGQILGWSRK